MTALQASIGALNDLHDAPEDAGRKPGKPIPAGLVSVPVAGAVIVAAAAIGIALAIGVDGRIAVLAVVVLLIGYGYDLVAKGTAWSWLPFAVGIPILPVYGWLAARGALDPAFAILVPAAVAAGAALAIANSLVDVDRDRAAGRTSVAAELGTARAVRVEVALLVAVAVAAVGSAAISGTGPAAVGVAAVGAIPPIAALAAAVRPDRREPAWRVEAVAIAVLAVAWTVAVLVRA